MQLSKHLDLVSCGFSTAANSVVEVDTKDCDGVMFIGVPGSTDARTWSLALKSGASTTGFVNCGSGNTLTSTDVRNDVLITDVTNPRKRYLGATLSSTTATPCWLLAMKYSNKTGPTTFSATANVPVAAGGYLAVVAPSST